MNELDAACNLVHDYPGGATSLGPRIGKNPTTLSHEVAGIGTAKLGLQTAVKLSVVTGDRRILEAFAIQCGCMILPLPARLQLTKINCLAQLGNFMTESGHVVRETVGSLADHDVSENDYLRVERECADVVSSISALLAAVRDTRDARRSAAGRKE